MDRNRMSLKEMEGYTVVKNPISTDDFLKAFRKVTDLVIKSENTLIQKINVRLAQIKDGENGNDGKNGKDADEKAIEERIFGKVMAKIKMPENGKDADETAIAERVFGRITPPKDGSPDTADIIRNKLELLPDGEKLSITAIEGIAEIFEKLEELLTWKKRFILNSGWSAAGGGRIVKSYDLSPKLDGVTTTFSLPAFWRVISVHLSSTPNILQPTVDYTIDGTLMKITFTAQLTPATQLSAGQTCLIIYAEP